MRARCITEADLSCAGVSRGARTRYRLDDLVVASEAIEQRSCHLGVAKGRRQLAEREIGGDENGGSFVEAADPMEEQLAADLCEGEMANAVRHDEVEPCDVVGDADPLAGLAACSRSGCLIGVGLGECHGGAPLGQVAS